MDIEDKISQFCTHFIRENSNYDNEKLEQINYGINTFLRNIFKLPILFITAYFLGIIRECLIVFTSFFFLRITAAGVHASSSMSCLIYTLTLFLGCSELGIKVPLTHIWTNIFFLVSLVLILLYAPADTQEKPIINVVLRKRLKVISVVIMLIMYIFVKVINNNLFSSLITYAVLLESLLITPIVYILLNKPYNNYLAYYNDHEFKLD